MGYNIVMHPYRDTPAPRHNIRYVCFRNILMKLNSGEFLDTKKQ